MANSVRYSTLLLVPISYSEHEQQDVWTGFDPPEGTSPWHQSWCLGSNGCYHVMVTSGTIHS